MVPKGGAGKEQNFLREQATEKACSLWYKLLSVQSTQQASLLAQAPRVQLVSRLFACQRLK